VWHPHIQENAKTPSATIENANGRQRFRWLAEGKIMGRFDEALHWWRLRRDAMSSDLQLLQSGKFRGREGSVDITQEWIEILKRQIEDVDRIIADCERRNT
jgi:hypothetical protein